MTEYSAFGITGNWKDTSFDKRLEPPVGAKIAIISYACQYGLVPKYRCLPHQVYMKKIVDLIKEHGADLRLISVDYVGNVKEDEQTIMVFDHKEVKESVTHSICNTLNTLLSPNK